MRRDGLGGARHTAHESTPASDVHLLFECRVTLASHMNHPPLFSMAPRWSELRGKSRRGLQMQPQRQGDTVEERPLRRNTSCKQQQQAMRVHKCLVLSLRLARGRSRRLVHTCPPQFTTLAVPSLLENACTRSTSPPAVRCIYASVLFCPCASLAYVCASSRCVAAARGLPRSRAAATDQPCRPLLCASRVAAATRDRTPTTTTTTRKER